MVVVKGEGSFADAVRKALEYAQSRGVDLSGVEVEVVADPSIKDFGAYAEHLGGLKFRIRYHPRYANNVVLAAHEAGHVAYWAWATKTGKTHFFSNPNVIEPLAEAFGAVIARQVFGVPVTFKDAPMNLTQVLPHRTAYITVTIGGKPIAVEVPEWGDSLNVDDYMKRYRAGVFLSPYFYNMTNWAHVFGNFTAMPADVVKAVHDAWRSGAVEVVPGWGSVWRKEPTWSWPDASTSENTATQQKPSDTLLISALTTTATPQSGNSAQKSGTTINRATPPQADAQEAVVYAQPSADVPLPPSSAQLPRYFSSDIAPSPAPPEWSRYVSGRRVLVVLRNWPSLDTATLKETRRDHIAGVGVVSEGRLRFEGKVPVPRIVDPNAWIELVDEKTGKVLARLRSDELYKLSIEDAPVMMYWSHVAAEEKWPGWERFIDRARELGEKLGTWRQSGAVAPSLGNRQTAIVSLDGAASAVKVTNAPTEYVPPKVPEDVRRQFEELLSELKKLRDNVNLKNVDEVHSKFIKLRDKALDIARVYPQLIDEANSAVEEVGLKVRETYDKLYGALAKAAGRDSFWRGDGDVKVPIGVYKYDPATGAFLLSLYDRPVAENIVGFIKDDGTPVVVKKTQNMSEALEEYSKKTQKTQTADGFTPPTPIAPPQPPATQPDFLQPLRSAASFLANALKTGASITLTALGGAKLTTAGGEQFVEHEPPQSGRRPVYNRRRGMPKADGSPGSSEPSDDDFTQQETEEFVVVKPSDASDKTELGVMRPLDYVLVEAKPSGQSGGSEFIQPPSGRQRQDEFVAVVPSRPLDYIFAEEGRSAEAQNAPQTSSGYRPADYIVGQQSGGAPAQPAEASQAQESSQKRHKGRPVAIVI